MAVYIRHFRTSGQPAMSADDDAAAYVLDVLEQGVNEYLRAKLPAGASIQVTTQLYYLQDRYHAVTTLVVYPPDDAPAHPIGFRS